MRAHSEYRRTFISRRRRCRFIRTRRRVLWRRLTFGALVAWGVLDGALRSVKQAVRVQPDGELAVVDRLLNERRLRGVEEGHGVFYYFELHYSHLK